MGISNRERLSEYPQLASLIAMLLAPAIDTGLNPEQAEAIYNQLLQHYSRLTGHAFWPLREKLVHLLYMADDDIRQGL